MNGNAPREGDALELSVLLLEDDAEDAEIVIAALRAAKVVTFHVKWVDRMSKALEALSEGGFDAILSDLNLPDSPGDETLQTLLKKSPELPILILTDSVDHSLPQDIMGQGAEDFIHKSELQSGLLPRLVRYAVERKKARMQMHLAQRKYRMIFEHSAVAILVTREDGSIESWNQAAEGMLGMTANQLYMLQLSALFSDEEWKRIHEQDTDHLGMLHSHETQVLRKGNKGIDVNLSLSIINDDNGKLINMIAVMDDISQRKKVAREIQRAEERYRTIFDNSAVAITVLDECERIVSWNKFAEGFLQMEYEDLYLRPVKTLYPDEEWKKIRGADIRTKGMQHMLETVIIRKDGTLLDVDISIKVLKDSEGKITGSIGIMKDISIRKRLQTMKDEFVSTVSHELRAPLSVVRESLAQIKDGILGDTTEKQNRVLDMSVNAIDHLGRIINDLLDVARMEAGKMTLQKKRVDMKSILGQIVEQFQPMAETKGLKLLAEFSEEDLLLTADQDRIVQVLNNLISNAFKFTDKGSIVIRAERLGDKSIQCSVTDTGCGIPHGSLKKVFSKFETFGRPMEGFEKGTGLGLSVCKGLVELHGGTIRVENVEGNGARFIFTLPANGEVKNETSAHYSAD